MTAPLLPLAALVAFGDATAARGAAGLPENQLFWWQVITAFGSSGYMFAISGSIILAGLVLMKRLTTAQGRATWSAVTQRAAYFFACIATSGLAAQVIKHGIGRLRPRLLAQNGAFHLIGPSWQSGADSFPSGHTTSAFAAAAGIALLLPPSRLPLLAVATLIGISRVATGNHFPSDVIVGAALGSSVSLALAMALARRGLVFTSGDAGDHEATVQRTGSAAPSNSSSQS